MDSNAEFEQFIDFLAEMLGKEVLAEIDTDT